eukprot:5719376-Amphidinium_carterae.1
MALAERLEEDIAWLECTPKYPIEAKFKSPLSSTHRCLSVRVGPELLGWPHRRMRVLGAAVNLKTMVWVGPDTQAEIAADFAARFHRSCCLPGSVFLQASEDERFEEYRFYAERQKNTHSIAELKAMSKEQLLRKILPPGGVARFYEWLAYGQTHGLSSLGGDFIFDCDHHPGSKGSTAGAEVPVNLTHGMVFAVSNFEVESFRLLLAFEQLSAMGVHVYDGMCRDFAQSPLVPALRTLSPIQVKQVLGNGMHLATQSAFMVYVLGHTVRRDHVSRLVKRVSFRAQNSWDVPPDESED